MLVTRVELLKTRKLLGWNPLDLVTVDTVALLHGLGDLE